MLYLRRSTREHQAESLDTQRANATAYCHVRGWIIVEVYIDDAVGRAEFVKRPALIRMLLVAENKRKANKGRKRAAVSVTGDFDLVVTRDETRLGGDMNRTGLVIQDLADANVGLHACPDKGKPSGFDRLRKRCDLSLFAK